jgi:hypothetical protein
VIRQRKRLVFLNVTLVSFAQGHFAGSDAFCGSGNRTLTSALVFKNNAQRNDACVIVNAEGKA